VAWLAFVKRVALLHRSFRLRHVQLRSDATSGVAASYVGEGESLRWLASLHGVGAPPPPGVPVPVTALARIVRSQDPSDVLYLEIDRMLACLLPRWAPISHPWISHIVDLTQRPPERSRAFEGVYGRKIRKHGLRHTLVTELSSVRTFYRELYLPYVEGRFGATLHPRSLHELERAVRSGFLIQVIAGDRIVAGLVCRIRREEVVALAYGLAQPHRELLQMGALSAASYFLLQWARARGLARVNLLRSRPHEADGVFEHKRRLGASPQWDPWPHTVLGIVLPGHGTVSEPIDGLLVRTREGGAAPLRSVVDRREP
jgi:hypothetical protein